MHLATLVQTLRDCGEAHLVRSLPGGWRALFTQRGARMLGLFPSEDAPNLLWTHPSLESALGFRRHISSQWNIGGERIWIAPEIQFNVADRTRFWETIDIPAAVDPGAYTLSDLGEAVQFEAHMALDAFNIAAGTVHLAIERTIQPVPDPLRKLPGYEAITHGVTFAGLAHDVTLRQTAASPIVAEAWNLVQLPAGGTLIIPCAEALYAADYVGVLPRAATHVDRGAVRVAITGDHQFKLGYAAACVGSRMGYLRDIGGGNASLLLRQFSNDPSASYTEEPPGQPGVNGFSVHVYNDGGDEDGLPTFGEMEASGRAISSALGRPESADTFTLWAYVGPAETVREIGRLLLQVAL
jgi:hypothetical protein